jgi:acetylornithine deacetylase/succinyl-diaminopimelate desuccinylase-like protein
MTDQRETALQYAWNNKAKFLDTFKEIVAIPSVSTNPSHRKDVNRAAEWLASQLRSLGMQKLQIFPTGMHPIVYGELVSDPKALTVLIYGHYDVQPADPLEQWKTSPFNPVVEGEEIYGRGTSDMKGEAMVVLNAVESLIKTGGLPVNIKWLLEGEEEIGSPHLGTFISDHKDLLACDFALNPDAGMLGKENPTITYALRGLAYFELKVSGPTQDLHSGVFGGVVHNPAIALAELIAGMHDSKGRVTLPGFYDRVKLLTKEERDELTRLPIGNDHFLEVTGAPALYGEAGFTINERTGVRPTLDVNGMLSGFVGEGSKTIIPATAMAKISMRLVPNQEPEEVHQQLIQYLKENAPNDIHWELTALAGSPASISDRHSVGVQAMSKALETVWGKQPIFQREGGSIPVVKDMQNLLGIESVICGFGLPDDNVHAPNEKMHLPSWYRGIETIIHFFLNLKA